MVRTKERKCVAEPNASIELDTNTHNKNSIGTV